MKRVLFVFMCFVSTAMAEDKPIVITGDWHLKREKVIITIYNKADRDVLIGGPTSDYPSVSLKRKSGDEIPLARDSNGFAIVSEI